MGLKLLRTGNLIFKTKDLILTSKSVNSYNAEQAICAEYNHNLDMCLMKLTSMGDMPC